MSDGLPSAQRIGEVLVLAPAELIAGKVVAYYQRRGQPKSGTDWRDLAMLLLAFPQLQRDPGPVRDCLQAAGADPAVLRVWEELLAQPLQQPVQFAERWARCFSPPRAWSA